ncbi:MAG: tetratricopeptide repeat protein, partial [Anaerolineae bacterium]|nr:tetratricopeptide repeat protein [Anaerolineae bacterium]
RSGVGMELTDLGMVMVLQGDYASAAAYLAEAVPLLEAIKARVGISHAYLCQGMLCHRRGDLDAAHDWLRRSLELAEGQADRRMQADALSVLGDVLADLGEWTAAREAYEDALNKRLSMRQSHLGIEPLAGLARVALGRRRLTESQDWLARIWPGHVGPLPDGLWDPIQVYLTGYRAWRAARDPRAERVLRTGAEVLQQRASQYTSDVRRRAFLDNVPSHRALVALSRDLVRL